MVRLIWRGTPGDMMADTCTAATVSPAPKAGDMARIAVEAETTISPHCDPSLAKLATYLEV